MIILRDSGLGVNNIGKCVPCFGNHLLIRFNIRNGENTSAKLVSIRGRRKYLEQTLMKHLHIINWQSEIVGVQDDFKNKLLEVLERKVQLSLYKNNINFTLNPSSQMKNLNK